MKNLFKLFTVVVLIAVLAACAPAATPAPTEPPATEVPPTEVPTEVPPTDTPAPAPVTIRYANWNLGTEEENNIQRQLIAAYVEKYPNVTIEIVDMSDPDKVGWDGL